MVVSVRSWGCSSPMLLSITKSAGPSDMLSLLARAACTVSGDGSSPASSHQHSFASWGILRGIHHCGAFALLWVLWVALVIFHLHYYAGSLSSLSVPRHLQSWPICGSSPAIPCLVDSYLLSQLRGHQSQVPWPGAAGNSHTYHRACCVIYHNLVPMPTHH